MLTHFVHLWKSKGARRTLLLLHGTGGDEHDLIPFAELIDPSANLLSLRGNSREEGVNRFFRRKAEGDLDEDDIRLQTRTLADFLDAAHRAYGLDSERTFALGYSNGANLAASLAMLYPNRLGGAILLRPMAPFRVTPEINGLVPPALVLAGNRDPIVSPQLTALLITQLETGGSKVKWISQNAGHELVRADVIQAQTWIEENFQDSSP